MVGKREGDGRFSFLLFLLVLCFSFPMSRKLTSNMGEGDEQLTTMGQPLAKMLIFLKIKKVLKSYAFSRFFYSHNLTKI
jgi:hypothetical protein